ncbi:MAG: hypothetical protein JHC79_07080 [Williamsia sp.]|nr:hypothetical protein [Williamsia sp.]
MKLKKIVIGSALAGGIALASVGAGAGVASAAPQAPHQNTQQEFRGRGAPVAQPGPVRRPDHRPFTYQGHRVTPVFDQHHHGWGFWFFGFWVPLGR